MAGQTGEDFDTTTVEHDGSSVQSASYVREAKHRIETYYKLRLQGLYIHLYCTSMRLYDKHMSDDGRPRDVYEGKRGGSFKGTCELDPNPYIPVVLPPTLFSCFST